MRGKCLGVRSISRAFIILILALAGAVQPQQALSEVITILHTSDEHGWIESAPIGDSSMAGGAAVMLGAWKKNEGYPNQSIVALSSGDMWTGPALSTCFRGESVVEVMSLMGYRAVAIGNHEFDFGIDILRRNRSMSAFPYLSANVGTASGKPADFAAPYVILEVSGIKLAVIGLSYRGTKTACMPDKVDSLVFKDYEPVVRSRSAEARGKGAAIVIILAHVPSEELKVLAAQVPDLSIPLMLAGHTHQLLQEKVGETMIVESGDLMRSYNRVDMTYDRASKRVTDVKSKLVRLIWDKNSPPPAPPDAAAAELVNKWQDKLKAEFGITVGFTAKGVQRAPTLFNLVTDAWLQAFPQADVALSNIGGFRQDIPAGPITRGSIVGVLPFDNTLYEIKLTGTQLLDVLRLGGLAAAGVKKMADGGVALSRTGKPVDPQATYRVIVNNFMYAGGDGFPFKTQDPNGRNTMINWRQPVIDWITAQQSSSASTIDGKLDFEPRGFEAKQQI